MDDRHRRACSLVDEAQEAISDAQSERGLIAAKLRLAARKLNDAANALGPLVIVLTLLSLACTDGGDGDTWAGETGLDVETEETGDRFRAKPVTVCVDYGTEECTVDGLGAPCPPTSWDACSSPWQPRACIDGGPCFIVHEGELCPQGSWDACKN